MGDEILSHDTIITKIRSAVFKTAHAWPTRQEAQKVLNEMLYERDVMGIRLTEIARQSLRDFRDLLRLPDANRDRGRIQCGSSVVALIEIARAVEARAKDHGTGAGR